jgi:hypothetical protein
MEARAIMHGPIPELPPPTPELVALRVLTEAHLRMLKPAKRVEFQRTVAEVLKEMDRDGGVVPIRPDTEEAQVRWARLQARRWISAIMQRITLQA